MVGYPLRRWQLALLAGGLWAGCAGPSMLGFPHANPRPATGDEISLAFFGGLGAPNAGHGGLGLSYSGTAGNTGVSASASAHYPGVGTGAFTTHLELALRPADEPGRDMLLLGLGYWGMRGELHAPQLSVGWLRTSPADDSGSFGGLRFHAGGAFDTGPNPLGGGYLFFLSAGGGYCWRAFLARSALSFQVEPYVGLTGQSTPMLSGGIQLMLTASWGI